MKQSRMRLPMALVAVFAYLVSFAAVPVAQANLLGTEVMIQSDARAARVAHVRDLLAQEQIAAQMVALGVDPAAAQARVASLTDAELASLEGKLENLPAGGGVLAVIGIVFLVLLVLELVGAINLFNRL